MQHQTIEESIVALETNYTHLTNSLKEVKESLGAHADEAKSAHKVTQEQIQEIKSLINQGKGIYRFIIFLSSFLGGGVMGAVTSSMANILNK